MSRLRRCSKAPSNAACEIVIGPKPSTSSTGDFSIPVTVSVSSVPFIEVTVSGLPTRSECSFAKPSSTIAPSAVSFPAVKSYA